MTAKLTDPPTLETQIFSVLLVCEAKLVALTETGRSVQEEAELGVVRELLRSIRQSWRERLH